MDKNILKGYLADYYENSKLIDAILNAFALELTKLENARIEMINQLQPESATYSLNRWENDYCLDNKDNYKAEYRRTIIIARMKGTGICTKEFIKSVALSYGNGEIEVIEPITEGDYTLVIKFIGIKGIPPNLEDFKNTIEEIIPAHMRPSYKFSYNTYGDIKNNNWNNEELKPYTYGSIKISNDIKRGE